MNQLPETAQEIDQWLWNNLGKARNKCVKRILRQRIKMIERVNKRIKSA